MFDGLICKVFESVNEVSSSDLLMMSLERMCFVFSYEIVKVYISEE